MNDKTVVLNAARMNYDGKLDFSILASEVTVYDVTAEDQLLERIQGYDIIVTKEMPVSGDLIRQFPDSVKLICEAGTTIWIWMPAGKRASWCAIFPLTAHSGLLIPPSCSS